MIRLSRALPFWLALALAIICGGCDGSEDATPSTEGIGIQIVQPSPTPTAPVDTDAVAKRFCAQPVLAGQQWEALCGKLPAGIIVSLIISAPSPQEARLVKKQFGRWLLDLRIGNPCEIWFNIIFPNAYYREMSLEPHQDYELDICHE